MLPTMFRSEGSASNGDLNSTNDTTFSESQCSMFALHVIRLCVVHSSDI